MKLNQDILIKYCLIIGLMSVACVQVDEFGLPEMEILGPDPVSNSNIIAVKSSYKQSGQRIYTFDSDDDTIIEGFVISSDEAGNFYKNLIVQDHHENPTGGIEVFIDINAYYSKFNFGRKIFIKMAGLSIGYKEGKYTIGYHLRNEIEKIPTVLIDDFIFRSIETEEIIPKKMSLSEFTDEQLNCYVEIENVQFRDDEIGKTFSGEVYDDFNGERALIQCDNRLVTLLSTSTFSDFKSNLIPANKGNLNAVLSKDYAAEKFVLILNSPSDLIFSDENRCDPDYLICDPITSIGRRTLFFENFEGIKNAHDIEILGWTNENVYHGNEIFVRRSSQGNVSMQISAYDTGEYPLEVWLITPQIFLDESEKEVLTFDSKATYDNGTNLTAWVSTDFESNIENATWKQINVEISVGPSNSFLNEFRSSGAVSLSCLEGKIHIAMRYQGGDPGIMTTYDLDNFLIRCD